MIKTSIVIITKTLYIRIPRSLVKSPQFDPTTQYEITIDNEGNITLKPLR